MWIKLCGILLILISGTGIGYAIAGVYTHRVNYLQELHLAINLINTEIVYKQTVLSEALKKSSCEVGPPVSDIMHKAATCLQNKKDSLFAPLWRDLLLNSKLHPDDKKIMNEWGKMVGSTQLAEQEKNNKLTMKKLVIARERAEKIADKKVKLARYSGVLISFLIIILCY